MDKATLDKKKMIFMDFKFKKNLNILKALKVSIFSL